MNFTDLALSAPLLRAIAQQNYQHPTPIQQQAIPAILAGRDLMAAAQTGTGKTAAFTLPIVQALLKPRSNQTKGNQVRALVVAPTRELAAQVEASVAAYSQFCDLKSVVVFGGVKINPQMQKLRGGADILVATPGRLLDLYQQNAIRFDALEFLVLDEADRMLDMGFIHDIKKIIKLLPKERQNLLFSATFSAPIRKLAHGLVNHALEISVAPPNSAAATVSHWLVETDKAAKTNLLIALIKAQNWQQVLVFTRTKHGANKLCKNLIGSGIEAAAIHGNKSQNARTRALQDFKNRQVQVLVATDIAARGIDIDRLEQVVNFELPNVAEDYVHRIGRTGRAGACGEAVSLVCADEAADLAGIERLLKQTIERRQIAGFAASTLPAYKPERQRSQAATPSENKANHSAHAKPRRRRRRATSTKPAP